MSESHDRGPKLAMRRTLRPKAAGHVWAWIILAVGLVLCMIITLWVVEAGKTTVTTFSDQDAVHAVAVRFKDRWSQAPGPPERYRSQALTAAQSGDLSEALRFTSMTLALTPDAVDDWLKIICLSCLEPADPFALTEGERHRLLMAMEHIEIAPDRIEFAKVLHQGSVESADDIEGGLRNLSRCMGVAIPPKAGKTKQETLDTLDVSP